MNPFLYQIKFFLFYKKYKTLKLLEFERATDRFTIVQEEIKVKIVYFKICNFFLQFLYYFFENTKK